MSNKQNEQIAAAYESMSTPAASRALSLVWLWVIAVAGFTFCILPAFVIYVLWQVIP